jgi:acyl-[acyl-carrier-protein]-phospholipid O-acyltransferase / long-chain-fatty-acid--[acyl-carrier-protein] ligase
MIKDSRAIFGISWFWFYSACVLSLYSTYGKVFLHVRQSVVTLFLVSFVTGIAFSYFLFKTLLKNANPKALRALSSFGMSFFLIYLFYVGRPTFSHSFIALGIREFVDYSDGLQILFALGALTVCSGLFVIPLYQKLSRSSQVTKGLIVTNNISNILFIILSAPFIYYLGQRKLDIFQTFLVLALSNGIVGGYFTLKE